MLDNLNIESKISDILSLNTICTKINKFYHSNYNHYRYLHNVNNWMEHPKTDDILPNTIVKQWFYV